MARRRPYTRPKNGKLQLLVRVHPGPGGLKTTTRDKTVTDAEILQWVDEQRNRYGSTPAVAGGLEATVAAYLMQRADSPSVQAFTSILAKWVKALGADRPPQSVETEEIDAILRRWAETVAAGTVHRRRSVLFTFYRTMFPKAFNPVLDAYDPPQPELEARELDYPDIHRALDSMPTHAKNGKLSLAKIRLRVLAETGFPPGLLGAIQPKQINWTKKEVFIEGREKGAGITPRYVELSDAAVDAFTAFHVAHAYGPYTRETITAMNVAFQRACRRIGLHMHGVTQYILRHSFLTQLYREHQDEATVQRLGLHAPGSRITRRYTKAAHPQINRAAITKLHAARTRAVQNQSQKLPAKVARRRKSFKQAS